MSSMDREQYSSVSDVSSNSNLSTSSCTQGDQNTKLTESDYETQYFGFSPESFCDGIYNALMSYTSDTLLKIQNNLKKEFADKVPEDKIERGTKKLMERFEKNVKKSFDKLEVYVLKSILHIPDDIILPEDTVHEKHPDAKQELQQVDAELLALKKRFINSKYVTARYRAAIQDLQKLNKEYDTALEPYNKLTQICRENGVADVVTLMQKQADAVLDVKEALHHHHETMQSVFELEDQQLQLRKRPGTEEYEQRMKLCKFS